MKLKIIDQDLYLNSTKLEGVLGYQLTRKEAGPPVLEVKLCLDPQLIIDCGCSNTCSNRLESREGPIPELRSD